LSSKFLFFFSPLICFSNPGDLISYTKKADVSPPEHRALCNSFSINCDSAKTCQIYTYQYETRAVDNSKATASGVLIVPKSQKAQNLLIYTHGTVSDKEGAPSRLGYHMQLPLAAFAQGDFYIVVPDYLGIGDSSCVYHPFCHAKTLATASYDAGIAAMSLLNKLSLKTTKNLYISGYSEGGMAALSLHKYVESNPMPNVNLKASCPMSGPYDLSSSISFALNSTSPRMNTYISYVISSYNLIYPGLFSSFSTVFSSSIDYMIPLLFDGCHTFWTINALLNKINPLLNMDFVKTALSEGSDFHKRLAENDTYTFSPKIPVHFIGLEKDSEVSYLNSVKAYNVMLKQNCPVSLENASSELDHMQGSALCHYRAFKYFQSKDQ
jgi:hypothetical protein